MNAASTEPRESDLGWPDLPAGAGFDLGDWPGPDHLHDSGGEPIGRAAAQRRFGPPAADADTRLAAWLDAVVDQDERALAALYDATVSRVFALVRRIVRSEALAEEAVEDTYFQVWRQALRFDPARGSAMTWLLAMARSRAIDTLRREARFHHETLEEDDCLDAGAEASPCADLLDMTRQHGRLQQALLGLGPQPRQLVSLAFLRGLSHEEIAEQMQLPLGTVKSQIRRALLALQATLGQAASPFAQVQSS
jgi:RNA polymerase sigma-70 factor (ECF subfamily)